MKRWIVVCAILVLVQAGLTIKTNLAHRGSDETVAKGALLAVQAASINGLVLEDSEGRKLELNKIKEHWVLPGSGGFPADSLRVQRLIDQLISQQRDWPEATTTEAATRFKVAAEAFAHKLTLLQEGKQVATVYFGTSAGLRKLYMRVDRDAEIHSLAIAPQDLETKADDWIDTAVLRLKPEQVVRIHLPGVELERTKDGLQPVALQEGEELIKERRDALVNRVTGLSITAALGKEVKPEYGLDTPALRYTVDLEGGTTISYTFGQPPEPAKPVGKEGDKAAPSPMAENSFVLKVSNQEQLLRVDGWQVEELKKASRTSLIQMKGDKKEEKTDNKAAAAPESEMTVPEAAAPEVTEPEMTVPEAAAPEMTEPEVTVPEAAAPEVTEPEVTTPPSIVPAPETGSEGAPEATPHSPESASESPESPASGQ